MGRGGGGGGRAIALGKGGSVTIRLPGQTVRLSRKRFNRHYLDNAGNYHEKAEGSSRGPISPINKPLKKAFGRDLFRQVLNVDQGLPANAPPPTIRKASPRGMSPRTR